MFGVERVELCVVAGQLAKEIVFDVGCLISLVGESVLGLSDARSVQCVDILEVLEVDAKGLSLPFCRFELILR